MTILWMEKQLDSCAIVITTYWGIEQLNALVERGVITHLNVKVDVPSKETPIKGLHATKTW